MECDDYHEFQKEIISAILPPEISHLNPILNIIMGYAFESRRWEKVADMSVERRDLGVAVCDGKLYAVGGRDMESLKSGECLRIAY